MGSDQYDEEKPVHRVTISKGFYMGVFPVTQFQWHAVMNYNPSHFRGDDRPVEMVSWDDCQEFCQKLRQFTGKPIRLPTEAEWEYACRAGTTTEYYTGNGEDALRKAGWYIGNSDSQTHPVGNWPPTPGGCTTCTATSGNGARTGMGPIQQRIKQILKVVITAMTACCVAAPGSIPQRFAEPPRFGDRAGAVATIMAAGSASSWTDLHYALCPRRLWHGLRPCHPP